jgi:hypothetical protein
MGQPAPGRQRSLHTAAAQRNQGERDTHNCGSKPTAQRDARKALDRTAAHTVWPRAHSSMPVRASRNGSWQRLDAPPTALAALRRHRGSLYKATAAAHSTAHVKAGMLPIGSTLLRPMLLGCKVDLRRTSGPRFQPRRIAVRNSEAQWSAEPSSYHVRWRPRSVHLLLALRLT